MVVIFLSCPSTIFSEVARIINPLSFYPAPSPKSFFQRMRLYSTIPKRTLIFLCIASSGVRANNYFSRCSVCLRSLFVFNRFSGVQWSGLSFGAGSVAKKQIKIAVISTQVSLPHSTGHLKTIAGQLTLPSYLW